MLKKLAFLPVIALVLAVAASAFRGPEASPNVPTSDVWYEFKGTSPNDVGNYLLYERTTTGASPGCSKSGDICAVQLPDNGTTPDEDDFDALIPAIESAQSAGSTTHTKIEMRP